MGSRRVLIANAILTSHTGTELYTRDLAHGLARLGHDPVVFSPHLGAVADELRAADVEVADRLEAVSRPPDVVQGHHLPQTCAAMLTFPDAAAVSVCHDARSWHSAPVPLSWVGHHVAVDEECAHRLRSAGIPSAVISVIPNAVDLERFRPRDPLPARPTRAAVFSNYARPGTHLDAVTEACARRALPVDVIGSGAGTHTTRPEDQLGRYDVVFATGRSALEALAAGCAVIVCDTTGLGGLVTAENVEEWRPWNYGRGLMGEEATPEGVLAALDRYDAAQNDQVRDFVRARAGLDQWLAATVELYDRVLERRPAPPPDPGAEAATVLLDLGEQVQAARSDLSRQDRALDRRRRRIEHLEARPVDRLVAGLKRRLPRPRMPRS